MLALYAKRWRIEADLRSLKRTVRLHHVAARNQSTMEKELLTAVAAYKLVRAVMALAARRHHLSPRQLSFTFVLNVVNARWHKLQGAPDRETHQGGVIGLLDAAAEGVRPKRPPRSSPRTVWHRGYTFPARKERLRENTKVALGASACQRCEPAALRVHSERRSAASWVRVRRMACGSPCPAARDTRRGFGRTILEITVRSSLDLAEANSTVSGRAPQDGRAPRQVRLA